jgi:hypothetical protein
MNSTDIHTTLSMPHCGIKKYREGQGLETVECRILVVLREIAFKAPPMNGTGIFLNHRHWISRKRVHIKRRD